MRFWLRIARRPRKQRHTARRLYRRILAEFPDATVAESAGAQPCARAQTPAGFDAA